MTKSCMLRVFVFSLLLPTKGGGGDRKVVGVDEWWETKSLVGVGEPCLDPKGEGVLTFWQRGNFVINNLWTGDNIFKESIQKKNKG